MAVSRDQADRVLDKLIGPGTASCHVYGKPGGCCGQAQKMLFTATPAESVDDVLSIIQEHL